MTSGIAIPKKTFPWWIVFLVVLVSQDSSSPTRAERARAFVEGIWKLQPPGDGDKESHLLFISVGGVCRMDKRIGTWSYSDGLVEVTFGKRSNTKYFDLDRLLGTMKQYGRGGAVYRKVSGS